MTCNPLRWLWGIVPLALLWWVTLLAEQPRIEADLAERSAAAMAQSGITWASTSFKGRDGLISGRAAEESEQRLAASIVSKVWGVSGVEDRTGVLELIRNYTWSAATREGELHFTGYVPSESARKTIIGMARAAFAGRKIDDQMKLARGAPEQGQWLGALTFAMKQLANLQNGAKVSAEGHALSFEGEAESVNAYKAIRTALSGAVPQGFTVKTDKVVAPLVRPYTWAAVLRGQQVELTGHVPSDRQRDQIFAAAKRDFPRATVVDRMVIGSGEPVEWQRVVTTALAKLGQMSQGNADLRDQQLTISGLTQTEQAADAIRASLKSDVPSSFRVSEQVRQDPAIKQQEEARRAAEEAARRAAEEAQRRAAEEAARRSAEEAQRRQAAEAEARRVAEQQRAQGQSEQQIAAAAAEEAARQRAAEDARRRAQDEERRAAEDNARRAAEDNARRAAAAAAARTQAAVQCQTDLRRAASAGSINFARASAEIDRQSHATLDQLAAIAKACPNATIEVGGHTDSEGLAARKQSLSERRAKAVTDYMVKVGVPPEALTHVGYGDSVPVAPNDSPENMARNRRIEFSVKAR